MIRGWHSRAANCRRSFTLAELLVVIVIIGILATSTLVALYGVMDDAKAARTRTQIAKLHSLIMLKWDGFRVRQVPYPIPAWMKARPENFDDANQSGWWETGESYQDTVYADGRYNYGRAYVRLLALRELMRLELPDRITDLEDGPRAYPVLIPGTNTPLVMQLPPPSVWRSYRRKANALIKARHGPAGDWTNSNHWTPSHEGAECLYLIVSSIRDGDTSGLDFFKESEIQDTDNDGVPEIVDGWGRPIAFLRWAPGFATDPGADGIWGTPGDDDGDGNPNNIEEVGWPGSDDGSELQPRDPSNFPDPFDPLRVHNIQIVCNRSPQVVRLASYALFPLIFSAGRDAIYDIIVERGNGQLHYATTCPPNDPFVVLVPEFKQIGQPADISGGIGGGDGELGNLDNITNHSLGSR